jgi:hypothetical protein
VGSVELEQSITEFVVNAAVGVNLDADVHEDTA